MTGWGTWLGLACGLDDAAGERVGDAWSGEGEWLATFEPPPHAMAIANPAIRSATFLGAETLGCVPISVRTLSKGNAILRVGLRFRYDPPSKAGHRPSPSGRSLNGFRAGRAHGARTGKTDGRCAVRFVLDLDGGIEQH